jgi:hypothetical protein
MPHPVGQVRVDGTNVSRIEHNVNDIQRAGFEIGMPLPTTQDEYISHTDWECAPAKGHQTRTAVNDDNLPKLVSVARIGGMIRGPNDRKRAGMLLWKIRPVQNP